MTKLFINPRTIDAQKAVPKLAIDAFGVNLNASISTSAFTTKENIPNVSIVKGRESSFKIGFINIFTIPRTIANKINVPVVAKYILENSASKINIEMIFAINVAATEVIVTPPLS